MKKLIVFVIFLGAAAGLTWLVWFRPVKTVEEEKKPEAVAPVRVATISRMTLRSYVTAYGMVEPESKASARVAVGVPGTISAVNCVEGQKVERGTILFELDSRTVDVAVKFAERSLERQVKLAQSEGTSQKLLQEAEQQLASARAQLALLQIRAPISGTLAKVNTRIGEAADLATVLGEVVDFERLVVNANVSPVELGILKVGQPAEITNADSTNAIQTQLTFISRQVDAKSASGLARAGLPVNCGLRLGQFVRVRVVSEERKDCVAVPIASLAKDPSGATFVALVDGDKAVLKPVRAGMRDGDWVEVEGDGVDVDKTVVTEGAYGLIMNQQFATKIRVVSE